MKVILSLIVMVFSLQSFAHEGHVHEPAVEAPPHGGLLRDAPPFKTELVLSGDQAKVYVYDKKLKPMKLDKESLTGELILPKVKEKKPVTFKRKGELYEATLDGISTVHRYDLHVNLEVGGKKALADFGVDNVQ